MVIKKVDHHYNRYEAAADFSVTRSATPHLIEDTLATTPANEFVTDFNVVTTTKTWAEKSGKLANRSPLLPRRISYYARSHKKPHCAGLTEASTPKQDCMIVVHSL